MNVRQAKTKERMRVTEKRKRDTVKEVNVTVLP